MINFFFFFFQAEDGIRDLTVTGVQTCALPIFALSAMNSQLYVTSRMMFSLSRGGYAPSVFGRLNSRGVPVAAIAISCLGIAVAVAVNLWKPEGSLLWMMSVSMFGAMFTDRKSTRLNSSHSQISY